MQQNILIIGAGKGIGLATAQKLCSTHAVYTLSRTLTPALQAISGTHQQFDVSSPNWDVLQHLPNVLHGIVYCPGTINLKPFLRLTEQDCLHDFQINVLGAFSIIQQVWARLKASQAASIVLCSSVAAQIGMPFHASIAMAKSAIEGLTKSLAAEGAAIKIRANAIAPSITATPLSSSLLNSSEKIAKMCAKHPLQTIGDVNGMAAAITFLLSTEASWITGQILHIDGGLSSIK